MKSRFGRSNSNSYHQTTQFRWKTNKKSCVSKRRLAYSQKHCWIRHLPMSRHDVAFTVKELASRMSNPTAMSCHRLENFLGYDKSHRKSTSGGFHALNSCPSFNGSGTLKVISLSSCEAELRAIVSSASDSIYIRSVLEFVTDSTTARQLTMKRIGKVKHLCGKLLGCYKYHQIAAWLTSTPGHLEDKESDFR